MGEDHIDRESLVVTGRHSEIPKPAVSIEEKNAGVVIVVTQAFGPKGDNIVGISDVKFDGFSAVTVGVRSGGREGLVHLSPIHGDSRKEGDIDPGPGATCELFCPVSKEPLDILGETDDGSGAKYCAIYLTSKLSQGNVVMLSNVWGHYHSRIIDDTELISYWATQDHD